MFRKILLTILFFAGLLSPAFAYDPAGKEQNCARCHALGTDEARDLLKDIIPSLKILEIRTAPVRGFWEVAIESGRQKGLVYVNYAKKHFFSGTLLSISDRRNLTQDRMSELNRVDVSQIPLEDSLVVGDKTAKYRVVVFDDPG
jgi:thiol:disulfide interchange protein DsbC